MGCPCSWPAVQKVIYSITVNEEFCPQNRIIYCKKTTYFADAVRAINTVVGRMVLCLRDQTGIWKIKFPGLLMKVYVNLNKSLNLSGPKSGKHISTCSNPFLVRKAHA